MRFFPVLMRLARGAAVFGTRAAALAALALLAACGPGTAVAPVPSPTVSPTPIFIPWPPVEETAPVLNDPPGEPTAAVPPLPTPTHSEDPAYFYGSLVVTLDDAGSEIHLKRRQNFLLSLGEAYNWTVEVDPERVVSQNMNLTPEPGEQGVYIARDSGVAELRAVGEPRCIYADPPCAWPLVLFRAQIVVSE